MTLEAISIIVSIVALAVTIVGATIKLTWALRNHFSEFKREFFEKFDEHEKLDNQRHEDNLSEFRSIAVALAQHGLVVVKKHAAQ